MDPDANIRETIALYRKGVVSDVDQTRLDELEQAYTYWRSNGGFLASEGLLKELSTVRNP